MMVKILASRRKFWRNSVLIDTEKDEIKDISTCEMQCFDAASYMPSLALLDIGQQLIEDKTDGCQEFMWRSINLECAICGCHRNFHRNFSERQPFGCHQGYHPKVPVYTTEVVYVRCHKVHDTKVPNSVDGCQEFTPGDVFRDLDPDVCKLCGCKKGYHRNEITREVI
ncbi:hypothetical protein ACJIZ3_023572 [Penstemon smallii]|uniref:ZF-HD dimerization-type domain-containing protein n=1 Tax=Penstemon smallii TaxID=265156 RepID=A0ABD3TQT9_9LAMI